MKVGIASGGLHTPPRGVMALVYQEPHPVRWRRSMSGDLRWDRGGIRPRGNNHSHARPTGSQEMAVPITSCIREAGMSGTRGNWTKRWSPAGSGCPSRTLLGHADIDIGPHNVHGGVCKRLPAGPHPHRRNDPSSALRDRTRGVQAARIS